MHIRLRSSWLSSSRRAMRSRSLASPSRMACRSSASRSPAARLAAASSPLLAAPDLSLACSRLSQGWPVREVSMTWITGSLACAGLICALTNSAGHPSPDITVPLLKPTAF